MQRLHRRSTISNMRRLCTHDHSHQGKCLGCYQTVEDTTSYHTRCSNRLFRQPIPPKLDTTPDRLEEIAKQFVSKRITLTGVQRKMSLSLEKKEPSRLTIIGSLGGTLHLKDTSPDYDEMPEIEDLSMHLRKPSVSKRPNTDFFPWRRGLSHTSQNVRPKRLKENSGGRYVSAFGYSPNKKYRSSAERVGKLIQRYSSVPGDEILRFFEVILFSYVIGNNDMHLKTLA